MKKLKIKEEKLNQKIEEARKKVLSYKPQ